MTDRTRRRLMFKGVWAALALSLLVVPVQTSAEEHEAPPPPPVLQVQLDWFMVPVTTAKSKKSRTVPASLFFKVNGPADVPPVCVFAPRIRDAVLQVLFKAPIEISKGKIKTEGLGPVLATAANRVFEKPRIAEAWVLPGIARADRGDLKALPFDQVLRCRDVRAGEEKILEQKQKAGEE